MLDAACRDVSKWAVDEFGRADLGDTRRVSRLKRVVRQIATTPAGKVTEAVPSDDERQATYDLLANEKVTPEALDEARALACVERCRSEVGGSDGRVVVVLDQSSIGVPDHRGTKDFGVVGNYRNDGRGLIVLTALALTGAGVPTGIAGQTFWSRPSKKPRRMRTHWRKTEDKETQRALELIGRVDERFRCDKRLRLCFVGDRGYDAGPVLTALADLHQDFVLRSCWNRRLEVQGRRHRRVYLRDHLARAPVLGTLVLHVPAGFRRPARTARLRIRSAVVPLRLLDPYNKTTRVLEVTAVWVHEEGTARGKKALDWMLFTNSPVQNLAAANEVIKTYRHRWRIEDFHRTWKSGGCNVEDSRLHTAVRLAKWAILLASVATRVERLKHLSRETPDAPATVALSEGEIRALLWFKRRHKKRNEIISEDTPSLSVAVRWIAQIGGYTGYGGPPGVQTIGRGYERIALLAEFLDGPGKSDE